MIRTAQGLFWPGTLKNTMVTTHTFPSLAPLARLDIPASFLDLPLRKDILHRAVVYERDALRQGTASTKTRAEVSGSTRKIRPQKGSGNARLGDRTSPMLRGGGRAHGPKPRDFSTELPRKVYNLAMRGAFSYLHSAGMLTVVNGTMDFPSHKTALSVEFLESHGFVTPKKEVNGRTLLIVNAERKNVEAAAGNVGHFMSVMRLDDVLISEVLKYPRVLIERKALLELERMTRPENKYKHIIADPEESTGTVLPTPEMA